MADGNNNRVLHAACARLTDARASKLRVGLGRGRAERVAVGKSRGLNVSPQTNIRQQQQQQLTMHSTPAGHASVDGSSECRS